jgi:ribosomal protein S18 acetylase RimI-like enzyme
MRTANRTRMLIGVSSPHIRRVRATETAELRTLRLLALADAPDAFAISLAEERRAPAEHWVAWARRGARGRMSVTYVALDAESWCGMAGGFLVRDGPRAHAVVFGVWVDPLWRGRGIGRHLLDTVVEWAQARGAAHVELWVTEHNRAARALYTRAGFLETGERQPLPSNPGLLELCLRREL